MAETEAGLVRRVRDLAPAQRGNGRSLHRPLLLLWAVGQAAAGQPRQQPWTQIRDSVTPLLARYAGGQGSQAALYPFWALRNNGLWEVEGGEDFSLTSGGRRPTKATLDEANPMAGLPKDDHELLTQDWALTARIAGSLLLRFFPDVMEEVAHAVGLQKLLAGGIDVALRPRVGELYKDRTTIAAAYGGNKVGGITPLEDGLLSVFSDDKGPYDDSRVPGTDWIAYTGDGLSGNQELIKGNKSMAAYQAERRALRYWHKPHGGDFTFETWAVVVQCRKRWGVGADGNRRQEYVWILAPVASPLSETWTEEVKAALGADDLTVHDDLDLEPSEAGPDDAPGAPTPMDRYRKLSAAARRTAAQRTKRSKLTTVERFLRSAPAREAVILRSDGRCENPECLGHPTERTDKGAPLLEVDHVTQLSDGGDDTPESMIALCPNCHALKTRGSNRRELSRKLLRRARELDQAFSRGEGQH
ncbi:HNH endonuclease signature motif containing protein [Streptomyces sp. NPDC097704]|uniref:HNH endonuclease signature motif containing protein n=1 Tax=Streptomyces sp. NPDC097704 TaxID=3157101 RepID=UPI00332FF669